MNINKEVVTSILGKTDSKLIYSEKAHAAFGIDSSEFERVVVSYVDDFLQWGIDKNTGVYHMKATELFPQVSKFKKDLNSVIQLQKTRESMTPVELKAVLDQSVKVYNEGVNILAPYVALMYITSKSKFKS